MIKNKKSNVEKCVMIIGLLIAFGLSCIAGYVLYSSTCALVIICMLSLLKEQDDN